MLRESDELFYPLFFCIEKEIKLSNVYRQT